MKKLRRLGDAQAGSEPIPKPTDETEFSNIQKDLTKYFNENKNEKLAKSALARLVDAGCDEKLVIQNLYLFCGGKPDAMRAVRTALNSKGKKRRLLEVAALLKKVSSQILVVQGLLEDLGITHTLTPDRASLDKYADFLIRLGERTYRHLSAERISGRDQHLVFLCELVKRVTDREHYREIADLINATRKHYDQNSTAVETAETVRKRVSRQPPNPHSVELAMTLEAKDPAANETSK